MKYRVYRFQTIVERRTFIVEAPSDLQALWEARKAYEYGDGRERVEICDVVGDEEWEVESCA